METIGGGIYPEEKGRRAGRRNDGQSGGQIMEGENHSRASADTTGAGMSKSLVSSSLDQGEEPGIN